MHHEIRQRTFRQTLLVSRVLIIKPTFKSSVALTSCDHECYNSTGDLNFILDVTQIFALGKIYEVESENTFPLSTVPRPNVGGTL